MQGHFACFLLPADFFHSTIRLSNSLDPDQAKHFIGPDLASSLHKLLEDDKRCHQQALFKPYMVNVLKFRTLKNNYFFPLFVILEIMFQKKC